ncbi:bifunctional demethylmenaquinone methyltransferase/2-methoxy-6-polyprenyl-1,4-benzoquinol methylase UbiE [Bartonella sp. DGB1]|uniref:bifunctional demethylmenaquinone methyltransferase/2-methoxy-6-polyprenyl-1,4-benzoquinol methylase UbiE n=1 Tax=Bartonella sp. DGB1 TaxID=3239807 RepID=UPI0035244A69
MDKQRVTKISDMEHSFGFTQITPQEKQPLVNNVFHSVANNYDMMNDIMSLGVHRLWKNAMISWLSPPTTGEWHILDIAGGTGDIAFRALKSSKTKIKATVLDINSSMLAVGKERANQQGFTDEQINFIEGDAQILPFPDNSFDAYTIAFGIRNVPNIAKALAEAHRVLKFGGRFMCLEFSEVSPSSLAKIYDLWSLKAIPWLGEKFTGDSDSYKYLVESIRKFPSQKIFAQQIEATGFTNVSWRNLTGGIAAIHSGWKI